MRSTRSTRKALKAEIEYLRSAVSAQAAPARCGALSSEIPVDISSIQSAEPPAAPVIAAGGLPLRSEPAVPKNLKEAKELLMSMREW